MMVLKCLRALSTAMAQEHGNTADIFMTAPGELLTVPMGACHLETNPGCQCRRIFVGLGSAQPTTLARVSVCPETEVQDLLARNPQVMPQAEVADALEQESLDFVPLHDLRGVAYAIRSFEIGSVVRVNRSADAVWIEDSWRGSYAG